MGGRNCCVSNCRRRSHDHYGRKIPNGLTFHCFPAWRTNEGSQISELTRRRRAAWVAAVGRSNITFNHIPTSMRVCSRHFHSGKPAYEMLESDPDWVPSLQLGHSEGTSRCSERLPPSVQRETEQRARRTPTDTRPSHESRMSEGEAEPAGGPERPTALPWRDIKSAVQSVLQRPSSVKEPPPHRVSEDFRDFFRAALSASLETSSRSRRSVSVEHEVELSFKLPPVKKEQESSEQASSSSSSSSSCLNCIRLQRTIVQLEEKLSSVTGEQVNMEARLQPEQDLQSLSPGPDRVHAEQQESGWAGPLASPQVLPGAGPLASPQVLLPEGERSRRPKIRPRPRFQEAWLKMFWFLRYSPSLDMMWCQVCRLHADKSHQNLALIQGSRMFKLHGIKVHASAMYHRENVERHLLQERDRKL